MKLKKVYIEITNKCNLQCSFCAQGNKTKQEMSVSQFKRVISQVKPFTNNVYLHVKGEPLLHPDLFALLQVCEDAEMRVNITTNGTLIQKVYKQLVSFTCIKKINFSLHCEQDKHTYFDDVFSAARILSKQMTIIYRLWTLQDNTLDTASKKIVDKIASHYELTLQTIKKLKEENNVKIAPNIYVDKDNEFKWPDILDEEINTVGYCYALKTHIAILVDGSVVPCCLDGEGVIRLGNLFEEELSHIIQSERFLNLKKSFQDRKPCEELCQKCSFKQRF